MKPLSSLISFRSQSYRAQAPPIIPILDDETNLEKFQSFIKFYESFYTKEPRFRVREQENGRLASEFIAKIQDQSSNLSKEEQLLFFQMAIDNGVLKNKTLTEARDTTIKEILKIQDINLDKDISKSWEQLHLRMDLALDLLVFTTDVETRLGRFKKENILFGPIGEALDNLIRFIFQIDAILPENYQFKTTEDIKYLSTTDIGDKSLIQKILTFDKKTNSFSPEKSRTLISNTFITSFKKLFKRLLRLLEQELKEKITQQKEEKCFKEDCTKTALKTKLFKDEISTVMDGDTLERIDTLISNTNHLLPSYREVCGSLIVPIESI